MIIQGPEEQRQNIHYEVNSEDKPLGVGGMGSVFPGVRVNERTGERTDVAIKFLFDDLPANVVERARREASVRIHNENLVEMFGFIHMDEEVSPGKFRPHYHVVSELLHGVMLHDLLNGTLTDPNGTEFPFARTLYKQYSDDRYGFAVFIVKNILSGIMALHDNGYIHRDLDPSNVMITVDGKVKIIDFGITKQLTTLTTQDKQLTTAGHFMGKAAYAAPELVVGDVAHQNATTDIYAIGVMLFQFIAGRLPFEGSTHEVLDLQLHGKFPLKAIENKTLRQIIAKATAKKQADRYQSAAEFRVAIEQFGAKLQKDPSLRFKPAQTDRTNGGETPEPTSARPIALRKYGIAIAACAAVVLCTAGILWYVHHTRQQEAERREQLIAQRIEALKDVLTDSPDPDAFETDSLSNYRIPSVGLRIREAERLLLSDSLRAPEGVRMLENILSRGYRSSAEAALLLGKLYRENEQPDSLLNRMRRNVNGTLARDNRKAHEMNRLAVQLDSTSYKGLYELGCDYYAGEYRTGLPDSRDLNRAKECFQAGMDQARISHDETYVSKCDQRMNELR